MSKKKKNEDSEEHILERYIEKLLRYYKSSCPWLFGVSFDPAGRHKEARKIFGFALGFVLGVLLYAFIIADLKLNARVARICGLGLLVLLSLGCAHSLQFRCICLLTIPGFFGRAGRSVLKALILGYVIAGPVFNLSLNAREVMRSFACTSQLTHNLTKTKYDLMLAPFRQAMKNLNESAAEIKETMSKVNDIVEPIVEEIGMEEQVDEEDDDDDEETTLEDDEDEASGRLARRRYARDGDSGGNFYEDRYRRKISNRCEKQLSKGSQKCRQAFRNAYERCFETVTWVAGYVLCWPMKLTFVCNFVQSLGGGKVCDPEGHLPAGFGEGYVTLKMTGYELNKSLSHAEIDYKIDTSSVVVAQVKEVSRAAAGVMRDFEARKRFLDSLITFIKRCLSFVFLKIVLNASEYHAKYLADIEHDNVYVSSYFRHIDARRKARGAATLLPLKKLERTKLLDPYSLRQSKAEKRHLYGQTAKLLLEIMTASTFVLLDKLLFELLDVIRRHAHLEISQSGRHDISLEIEGRGLVASLVRKLVRGFNRKRQVSQLLSNEACLPRPSRVPGSYLWAIYLGYLGVWLLLLLQAYGQRLRRVFGAFFYRRREKRRVLHLYNETLRRRQGFLRWARSRAAQAARARLLAPEGRFWLDLRESRPKLWAWLRRLGFARLDCAVCGDPEPRGGERHHLCRGSDCLAAYCDECWRDLGRSCWSAGCASGAPHDHVEETDNEFNDDGVVD